MTNPTTETIVPYSVNDNNLANGADLDIDPAEAPGPGPTVLEVAQIVHGDDCDVKFLVDVDGDGTYEIDETMDSFTGEGISMGNEVLLYETENQVLRVTNTGSAAAFVISGRVIGGLEGRR